MRRLPALLLCVSGLASAQETDTVPPPPRAPCSDAAYRQFDFWIGDWEVTANGEPAGRNSIYPVHKGCALEENWQGSGTAGVTGSSLNIYDRATGRWHQTWVDGNGLLLQLDGGIVNGAMVLSGERQRPDGGGLMKHRITWTPNEDGSMRQLWEVSRDGQSWSVLFDGLYRPAATAE